MSVSRFAPDERTSAAPSVLLYLRYLAGAACAVFCLAWAYIVLLPIAVLDEEYPVWLAKSDLIAACDLGSVLILGDSRVMVGINPHLLPVKATNLAYSGGTAIEAYYAARRALRCPASPARAVISIGIPDFIDADEFWYRTMRFDFLSPVELLEVEAAASELHDPVLQRAMNPTGIAPAVLGWLYLARFPPVYFNSLANSGLGFYRHSYNRQVEAKVARARGQSLSPLQTGISLVGPEASITAFTASPVLDHYFERLVVLLIARGIQVDFVVAPVSQTSFDHVAPAVARGYAAYLDSYARRYKGIRVIGADLPHWPDKYFCDPSQHLVEQGADLFTTWLGGCLRGLQCDSATLDGWAKQKGSSDRAGRMTALAPTD